MSRLNAIDPARSTGKSKDLLDAVQTRMGQVPNMTRLMANAPSVLEAYLGFSGALGGGLLDAKTRQQLALVVAQDNRCDYCLSAHNAIGKMVGLMEAQIAASRKGHGTTERTTAALTFARQVLAAKGQVSDAQWEAVRAAGFSDGEIAEILAHVALNVMTNYFNLATQPDIDFPKVSYAQAG